MKPVAAQHNLRNQIRPKEHLVQHRATDETALHIGLHWVGLLARNRPKTVYDDYDDTFT